MQSASRLDKSGHNEAGSTGNGEYIGTWKKGRLPREQACNFMLRGEQADFTTGIFEAVNSSVI